MIQRTELIVIGGSAGSLDVLFSILPSLDPRIAVPLVIVLHRKPSPNSPLTEVLSVYSPLQVKEAEDKEELRPGVIYLAPADYHLLIELDRTLSLDASEKVHFCRPSIDATFESGADAYGNRTAGILLSGANADGIIGLKAIKKHHGLTAAQDPHTAKVPYMPYKAVGSKVVDRVLKPEEIPLFINKLGVNRKSPHT